MKIRDVMSRPVYCVRPYDSLTHAREEMINRDVSTLLVLADDGQPAGILTETDVAFKQHLHRAPDRRTPGESRRVEDVMTEALITMEEEASIAEAAQTMLAERAHALPVLDADGAPVGIVTRTDLLRAITDALDDGTRVEAVHRRDFPVVHRHTSAVQLVELMQERGARAVGVVEGGVNHRGPERVKNVPQSTTSERAPWEVVGLVCVDDLAFGQWLDPVSPHRMGKAGPAKRINETRKFSHAGRKGARHVETTQWVAEDLMRTEYPVLGPNDTLDKAAHALADARVGAAPVVGDDGRLLGCIPAEALLAHYVDVTQRREPASQSWRAPRPR